jgi:manganese/zinc/iron transport system substrate-binding protein
MKNHTFSWCRSLLLLSLPAFALAVGSTGCLDTTVGMPDGEFPDTFQGEYPFLVVCTTGMVADVVRHVGGEHVSVLEADGEKIKQGGTHIRIVQLMGEGTDPHLYKASPGDLSRLDTADLIFYSGLHLEGKLSDLFERMAQRKPTFAVAEPLETAGDSRLLSVADGYHDPHIWFDVSLWSETLDVVAEELAQFDPDHAADYWANAKTYREELAELHTYCQQQIATIPEKRRVLVTAHDAFHYFGRAYGLKVMAIQGVSTGSETSTKHIDELVEFIISRGIKAVFIESTINERSIQVLIDGCQARGQTVKIGGELFSDAMGKPGTAKGTYVGMVHHNVDTIVRALK